MAVKCTIFFRILEFRIHLRGNFGYKAQYTLLPIADLDLFLSGQAKDKKALKKYCSIIIADLLPAEILVIFLLTNIFITQNKIRKKKGSYLRFHSGWRRVQQFHTATLNSLPAASYIVRIISCVMFILLGSFERVTKTPFKQKLMVSRRFRHANVSRPMGNQFSEVFT